VLLPGVVALQNNTSHLFPAFYLLAFMDADADGL
jgi:hypothetical protein